MDGIQFAVSTKQFGLDSLLKPGTYKDNRRLLFFPTGAPAKPWSELADADPDPFADEVARAAKVRAAKNAKAKARRAAATGTGKSKAGSKKKAASKKSTLKTCSRCCRAYRQITERLCEPGCRGGPLRARGRGTSRSGEW